jgi:phosphatidate phosphatase APP1
MRLPIYLALALLSGSCTNRPVRTCPASTKPFHTRNVVISDIDDTIKDTHVKIGKTHITNPAIVFDGLHRWHRVAGMDAFFRKWANPALTTVIYVSAGPCYYRRRLEREIPEWRFPPGEILLREHGPFPPAPHDYKTKAIYPIIKNSTGHHFFLVGDSGEFDPECYGDLAREFPSQIDGIYIRKISRDETARYDWAFRDIDPKKLHDITK